MVWSRDNNGLAVAGDERVVRLFKVKAPNDFKSDMEMTLELKTEHLDSINSVDISPNKTLLITAGNDSQAQIFDLRSKSLIKSLTFRDKNFRDTRGNPDNSNFAIKGCRFSLDSSYVYILASKYRYKSFVVAYSMDVASNGAIVFSAHSVLDVHDQFASSLGLSPEGDFLSVLTSDGCIKVVDRDQMKMLTS